MALQPCVYCHRVPRGPLHALIFAWYLERHRVATRLRCCAECLLQARAPFGDPLAEEGDYIQLPTSCGRCNEPLLPDELAEVYLTDCFKGDREKAVFAICNGCAAVLVSELRSLGEELPDRPLYAARRGP